MSRTLTFVYAFLIGFWVLTAAEAREQVAVERTGTSSAEWWFYTNVTPDELKARLKQHKARIVDLDINQEKPLHLSATLVADRGDYRSNWLWYYGKSADEVAALIKKHNGRLIDLDAYHVNGALRFAIVMVPNAGKQQVGWWWYYGQSVPGLEQKLAQHKARLVNLDRYTDKGQTRFAAIMVQNTGPKAQNWWWYVGLTEADLKSKIFSHRARILDLEQYDFGQGKRFAAVLIPSAGESRWWWWHGKSSEDLLFTARRLGARIVDIEAPGNSIKRYAALMTDNGMIRSGECGGGMNSFDREIIRTMKRYKIPGASAAVVKDGRLVYACGFGYADIEAGTPVTPQSQFRIASVSKPLTISALRKLEAEGRLTMGDKMLARLGGNMPKGGIKDQRLKLITLEQLVDHKAGWDTDKMGFDPMFASNKIANALGTFMPVSCPTVMRYMFNERTLNFTPGTDSFYSNFGYCVLGRVIEAQSGQNYETYVRQHILNPAGVSAGMRLGRTLVKHRYPNEVRYYDHEGADNVSPVVAGAPGKVQRPDGGFNLEAMDAHGGWVGSALDVARFAQYANPQPWNSQWAFEGSLPGTRSRVERSMGGDLIVVLLFNTRPVDDLDKVIARAVKGVRYWPTPDRWASYGYGSTIKRAMTVPPLPARAN